MLSKINQNKFDWMKQNSNGDTRIAWLLRFSSYSLKLFCGILDRNHFSLKFNMKNLILVKILTTLFIFIWRAFKFSTNFAQKKKRMQYFTVYPFIIIHSPHSHQLTSISQEDFQCWLTQLRYPRSTLFWHLAVLTIADPLPCDPLFFSIISSTIHRFIYFNLSIPSIVVIINAFTVVSYLHYITVSFLTVEGGGGSNLYHFHLSTCYPMLDVGNWKTFTNKSHFVGSLAFIYLCSSL